MPRYLLDQSSTKGFRGRVVSKNGRVILRGDSDIKVSVSNSTASEGRHGCACLPWAVADSDGQLENNPILCIGDQKKLINY